MWCKRRWEYPRNKHEQKRKGAGWLREKKKRECERVYTSIIYIYVYAWEEERERKNGNSLFSEIMGVM